jgi:hypothetical protein
MKEWPMFGDEFPEKERLDDKESRDGAIHPDLLQAV